MAYEVLEVIGLPVVEEREIMKGVTAKVPTGQSVRKEPGDKITKKELQDAGQDDDDIQSLIDHGAMKETS